MSGVCEREGAALDAGVNLRSSALGRDLRSSALGRDITERVSVAFGGIMVTSVSRDQRLGAVVAGARPGRGMGALAAPEDSKSTFTAIRGYVSLQMEVSRILQILTGTGSAFGEMGLAL
jgi:hypothetical protein